MSPREAGTGSDRVAIAADPATDPAVLCDLARLANGPDGLALACALAANPSLPEPGVVALFQRVASRAACAGALRAPRDSGSWDYVASLSGRRTWSALATNPSTPQRVLDWIAERTTTVDVQASLARRSLGQVGIAALIRQAPTTVLRTLINRGDLDDEGFSALVRHPDPSIREATATQHAEWMLHHPDLAVRQAALPHVPEAAHWLKNATSSNPQARVYAATAAPRHIQDALPDDTDARVRAVQARSTRDPDRLARFARDSDVVVRVAAAENPSATDRMLRDLREDAAEAVAAEAERALVRRFVAALRR